MNYHVVPLSGFWCGENWQSECHVLFGGGIYVILTIFSIFYPICIKFRRWGCLKTLFSDDKLSDTGHSKSRTLLAGVKVISEP